MDTAGVALYQSLHDEHDYVVDEYEGDLPDDLRGTLYRNGPGKVTGSQETPGHLLDGDGMVSMFSIADGRLSFRNRYVRTRHYRQSLVAKGSLGRGFSAMQAGGILANVLRPPANVANTGVVMHAGNLLALWEGGRPTKIDPDTLATIGKYDFDGDLSWFGTFSAHPKKDPQTGEMLSFGMEIFPTPAMVCHGIDGRGKLRRLGRLGMHRPRFNHDFAITPGFLVFAIPPLVMPTHKLVSAGLGLTSYIDAIEYDSTAETLIVLVPRYGGKTRVYLTDPMLHMHISNAHEDGSDVVVDLVTYQLSWQQLNEQFSLCGTRLFDPTVPFGGSVRRLRIGKSGRVAHDQLGDALGEFPTCNPQWVGQQNRFTYLAAATAGSPYPNLVVKIDSVAATEVSHLLPPGHLAHEAIFAPRPGGTEEDDGWLLVVTQDLDTDVGNLIVLDAKNLAAEPIYVGRLRHHMPLTFHGCFTPRVARACDRPEPR
jgi:all-trans-8'-apo-beta-carotenal 15,15'-oxygenase